MLDKKRIALIHVARAYLCLDETTYRAILKNFGGAETSTALTIAGFNHIMEHFIACGFIGKNKKMHNPTAYQRYVAKWKALGLRPGMASPEQLAMIECLWDSLSWYWNAKETGNRNAALYNFTKKRFKNVEHLRFLSGDEACKVIEALKAIQFRRKQNL